LATNDGGDFPGIQAQGQAMIQTDVKYDMLIPTTSIPMKKSDWHQIGLIVREEIQRGIMEQVDVTGKAYPGLTSMTIMGKRETAFTGQKKIKAALPKKNSQRMTAWGLAEGKSGPQYRSGARSSAFPTKRLMRSGNLIESPYPTATASQVEVRLGKQREQIGRYHQEGIRPHKITAKKGAIPIPTENGLIFRKNAQHPGTPPVPFFGISERCASGILDYVSIAVDKWLKEAK
jgi:hypothetical protein